MLRPVCIGGTYAWGADTFTVTAVTVSSVCIRSGTRFCQLDLVTFHKNLRPVVF